MIPSCIQCTQMKRKKNKKKKNKDRTFSQALSKMNLLISTKTTRAQIRLKDCKSKNNLSSSIYPLIQDKQSNSLSNSFQKKSCNISNHTAVSLFVVLSYYYCLFS